MSSFSEQQWQLIRMGIMSEMRVDSLEEALSLANQLKQEGVYDLFRGQVDSRWKVTSSFERLPESKRKEAQAKLERFVGWARSTPEMERYAQNEDALIAIAQHYGLPTTFIDFTDDPRIAAFFACDHNQSQAPEFASIICLKKSDFVEFWETAGRAALSNEPHSRVPEILTLDVENLWRLQAQRGCFLYNPIENIEGFFYNFDRIIFPSGRSGCSLPDRELIYPKNQSHLEHLLQRFFLNELMHEGAVWRESLTGVQKVEITVEEDAYELASWYTGEFSSTDDWQNIEDWTCKKVEAVEVGTVGPRISLATCDTINSAADEVLRVLTEEFISRHRDNGLFFDLPSSSNVPLGARLVACVRRLWNGMRRLPYTNAEIRESLEVMIQVFLSATRDPDSGAARNVSASRFGPKPLYVEMCSRREGRGDYSRGYVSREMLREVHNPAFLQIVGHLDASNPKYEENLLLLLARPHHRFSFAGLRTLLVKELIPSQIVTRGDREEDDAPSVVYFSPTEFTIFGLA